MKKVKILFLTLMLSFGMLFNLSHAQIGSNCDTSHVVTALPFTAIGLSTAGTGNNYTSLPCSGSFPNYLSGNDYVFSYTPADDMSVKITLSNTATAVAVFVTAGCLDTASACIANNNSVLGNPIIPIVNLTGGVTYFITVSRSSLAGASTDFDIEITRLLDHDLSITNIPTPVSECYLSNNENVTIVIKNNGLLKAYDFELGYSLDGNAITPILITDTLKPDSVLLYTFTQTVDLSTQGQYLLSTYVIYSEDEYGDNDTLNKIVAHFPTITTLPYTEDFESGDGGWAIGGTNPSWQLGNPDATIINTPAIGGTNSWVTNLTGNHNFMENSFVSSPCFDLSNYPNVSIKLDVWYETAPMMDGGRLEATIDGGSYWFVIGDNNEPFNWYNGMMIDTFWTGNSYAWVGAQHPLNFVGGQSNVRFRVRYKTGLMSFQPTEGFAFDNILIYECNDMPTASFTYTLNGMEATFTNTSIDATYYLWDFGEAPMPGMPGDTTTNPTHTYAMGGPYMVTLAAYNECGVSYYSENIHISMVNIDEELLETAVIYPNPASSEVNLFLPEMANNEFTVNITNTLGQLVYSALHNGSLNNINIKHLTKGVYFINVVTDSQQMMKKLIIE